MAFLLLVGVENRFPTPGIRLRIGIPRLEFESSWRITLAAMEVWPSRTRATLFTFREVNVGVNDSAVEATSPEDSTLRVI